MEDRRSIPRWRVDQEAKVRVNASPESDDCLIGDLNLKGARVLLNRRLPAGETHHVSLAMTGSCTLEVDVRAPWHQEQGGRHVYGLFFTHIADAEREKIYRYLSGHCARQIRENWWSGTH